MNEKIREKGREYAEFLLKMSEAEWKKGNEAQLQKDRERHKCFQENFREGICCVCTEPLSIFKKEAPCLHWLLLPHGFKKKDFLLVTKEYGFFQIQVYLRWVANEDGFARNINDLPIEGSGKLFETTIRYKHLEWSFSYSETDYLGNHASQPHYHFQMRVDSRPFIDYADFHIPFNEFDITTIEAKRTLRDIIEIGYSFGEGMRDVLTDETAEQIVNSAKFEGVRENAPLEIDTFAIADEGKTISGKDIYNIIQEANEKKVTMSSLMHKLENASVRFMVSPGPGVVKQAPRSKRKKPKS